MSPRFCATDRYLMSATVELSLRGTGEPKKKCCEQRHAAWSILASEPAPQPEVAPSLGIVTSTASSSFTVAAAPRKKALRQNDRH
eukprot:789569-Prymnesium_polylepis.1